MFNVRLVPYENVIWISEACPFAEGKDRHGPPIGLLTSASGAKPLAKNY